jgi:hypothetical protein
MPSRFGGVIEPFSGDWRSSGVVAGNLATAGVDYWKFPLQFRALFVLRRFRILAMATFWQQFTGKVSLQPVFRVGSTQSPDFNIEKKKGNVDA